MDEIRCVELKYGFVFYLVFEILYATSFIEQII